jgi:alkylation response protein AidB-like acyl-CoA dehydrogenase
MHFDLTEEQREIRDTAHRLLARESSFERVRAAHGADDEALSVQIVELGWPATTIPERYSGLGLGMVELCVLAEQLGYSVAATPFLGTALAGVAIARAGDDRQQQRWLPSLAQGTARGALAYSSRGQAILVPDAQTSDVVVVADKGRLNLVDKDAVSVRPTPALDLTRRYGHVEWSPDAAEPLPGDAHDVLARAAVVVAAELVGVCQRALDLTVAYVKEREQFGVAVGSFQAVAHRCVEMLIATEGARSAVFSAAWAADADQSSLVRSAAIAKGAASDAGRMVTASAIQAHGGIGFTWEADLHWLLRRAQVDAVLFGGGVEQRATLAECLRRSRGAQPPEPPVETRETQ